MALVEMEQLKADYAALTKAHATLQEQMQQVQEVDDQEITRLWDQIATLQKQLTLERDAAKEVEHALQQKLTQVNAQLEKCSQAEVKLTEATRKLADAKRQAADAERRLDDQRAQHKTRLADVQKELEKAQKAQRTAQRENERLEKENSRKEQSIQTAYKEAAQYKSEISDWEAKLERAKQWEEQAMARANELQAAQQELQQLRQEVRITKEHSVALGQARAELVMLQQQSAVNQQQAAAELEQVKAANAGLRHQLESRDREVNSLAHMRNHLMQELDKRQGELKSVQEEYDRAKAKFTTQPSEADLQANRAAKYKKALQQEQDKSRAELVALRAERDRLKDDIHAWQVNDRKLRRQLEKLQGEINQLRHRQQRGDLPRRRGRSMSRSRSRDSRRGRSRSTSASARRRSPTPSKLSDERGGVRAGSMPEGSSAGGGLSNGDAAAAVTVRLSGSGLHQGQLTDQTKATQAATQADGSSAPLETSPLGKPVIPSWSELERKMADTRKAPKPSRQHAQEPLAATANAAAAALADELMGDLPPGYGAPSVAGGAQYLVAAAADGLCAEPPLPGETLGAITQAPAMDYGNSLTNMAAANPYPDTSYTTAAAIYSAAADPGSGNAYYAAGYHAYAHPLTTMVGQWQHGNGTGGMQGTAAMDAAYHANDGSEPGIPGVDESTSVPSQAIQADHVAANLRSCEGTAMEVDEALSLPHSASEPHRTSFAVPVATDHTMDNTQRAAPPASLKPSAAAGSEGWVSVSLQVMDCTESAVGADAAAEQPVRVLLAVLPATTITPAGLPRTDDMQVDQSLPAQTATSTAEQQTVGLPNPISTATTVRTSQQQGLVPDERAIADRPLARSASDYQDFFALFTPKTQCTTDDDNLLAGNQDPAKTSHGGDSGKENVRSKDPSAARHRLSRDDDASTRQGTRKREREEQDRDHYSRKDRSPGRGRSPVHNRDHSRDNIHDGSTIRVKGNEHGNGNGRRRSPEAPREGTAGGYSRRDRSRDSIRSRERRPAADSPVIRRRGTSRSRSRERRDRYPENGSTPAHRPDTGSKWPNREPPSGATTHATRRSSAPSPSTNLRVETRQPAALRPRSSVSGDSGKLPAAGTFTLAQPAVTPSSNRQPLYEDGLPQTLPMPAEGGAATASPFEMSGRGTRHDAHAAFSGAVPGTSNSISIDPQGMAPASLPGAAAAVDGSALPTQSSAGASDSIPAAGSGALNAFQRLASYVFDGSDMPSVILRKAVQLLAGLADGPLGPHTINFSNMLAGLKKSIPSGLQSADLKEAYTQGMKSGVLQLLKVGEDMKVRIWKLDIDKLKTMSEEVMLRYEAGHVPAADPETTTSAHVTDGSAAIAFVQNMAHRTSISGLKRPRDPSPHALDAQPARKPHKARVTDIAEDLFSSGNALDAIRLGIVHELCNFASRGPCGAWAHTVEHLEGVLVRTQPAAFSHLCTLYTSPTLAAVAGVACFHVRKADGTHIIALLRSSLFSMATGWTPPTPPMPDLDTDIHVLDDTTNHTRQPMHVVEEDYAADRADPHTSVKQDLMGMRVPEDVLSTSKEIKQLASEVFNNSTVQDRMMRLALHVLADSKTPNEELGIPVFANTTAKLGVRLMALDREGFEAVGRVREVVSALVNANVAYYEIRKNDALVSVNLEGLRHLAAPTGRR